ncbi:MAG: thermonuclease family protein [Micropruina sp.]|nr:thermonuclease family protein [Micropruina sp.]
MPRWVTAVVAIGSALVVLGVGLWWIAVEWPKLGATAPVTSVRPMPTQLTNAKVERVIDGDTLDVTISKKRVRLRLLNIDSPELRGSTGRADCLAEAARSWVQKVSPTGSRLRLEVFGKDQFGRTLAGAYLDDGRLLNAEVARVGLAGPLVVNRMTQLLAPVRDAVAEADRARVGLHADTGCSIPGRLARATRIIQGWPSDPSAKQAKAALSTARDLADTLASLEKLLTANARNAVVQALPEERQDDLLTQVRELRAELKATTAALQRAAG